MRKVWHTEKSMANIAKTPRPGSEIEFSCKITVAYAVLHNFCIKARDQWDDDNGPDCHNQNRQCK